VLSQQYKLLFNNYMIYVETILCKDLCCKEIDLCSGNAAKCKSFGRILLLNKIVGC